MIFASEHITAASGSVGGVTYSRARGGTLYRRARAIPVNPDTVNQVQVRSALTALVTSWIETLTSAQREAWDLYSDNVTVTNAIGSSSVLSGQNWYIGSNVPRLQSDAKLGSSLGRVDSAPAIFDRGEFTTPSPPAYDVVSGLTLSFTEADAWVSETNAALLVFQGRPRNPSRTFFGGPYRLIAVVAGDSTTPPTSPLVVSAFNIANLGYPLTPGQLISTSVSVVRADGRASTRRRLEDTVVTSP